MLRQLVNECIIELAIVPKGPILIKSGIATISGPDMAFVRTWRNGEAQVYLPGSSLKGVLRSHAERITRTLNLDAACDPFVDDKAEAERRRWRFCGSCFKARKDDPADTEIDPKERPDATNRAVYRDSCPICRLFGSTWFAGRLATADAYPEGEAPQPQQRDGVGIDRFTGGAASRVKFDLEVITDGIFVTRLHLRNFELWQLGLLGFVFQDLADELVRIGAGKSRGLGQVRGTVRKVDMHFLGMRDQQPTDGKIKLRGVGSLSDLAAAYGMTTPDEVEIAFSGQMRSNGLRRIVTFTGDTFPWTTLGPGWVKYARNYPVPPGMAAHRAGGG